MGILDMKLQHRPPLPYEDKRPVVYADRIGQWYAATASADHKKDLGQYLTPIQVAEFMARLYESARDSLRVLDPGAGTGILSCALCEALIACQSKPIEIELEAYEADDRLVNHLSACLPHAGQWL
jgi:adenine-specific DNA-methyltransferase